ncbi:MAG TPA: DUF2000 family protein [Candidatus Paceibacterota bacterium]
MEQDFSRKMSIAVREDMVSWQLTNTIGHIAAVLGNKLKDNFDTGEYFSSKEGIQLRRNSQYAIVALKASSSELKNLIQKLQEGNFLWVAYTQDMMDLIDDSELVGVIGDKTLDELDILGVGIFASKDDLKTLTGKLSLWK